MVTRPESVGDRVTSSTSISDDDTLARRAGLHRSEHPARPLSGGKTFYSIENQADGSFRAKNPRTSSQKRRGRQRVSEDTSSAPEISRKTSGSRARAKRSSAASATAKRESTSSASRNQNSNMPSLEESRSDKTANVFPSVTLTGSSIETPDLTGRSPPNLTPRPARSPSQKRQGRQRHSRELSASNTATPAAINNLTHIAETAVAGAVAVPQGVTPSTRLSATDCVPSEHLPAVSAEPSHQAVSSLETPPSTDELSGATADKPSTDEGSTATADSAPPKPPAIPQGSGGSTLSLGAVMDSIDAILRELATFSEESKAPSSNIGHNNAQQRQPDQPAAPIDTTTNVQRTRSESMRAAMIQPLTEGVSATTVNMIIRDHPAQRKPPPGTALPSLAGEAATRPDSTANVGELVAFAPDHAARPPHRYGDRMLRACQLSADPPSAKRREHKTRVCLPFS